MNVLIVGAGPAGIAATKTLLDNGFSGNITLIERGRDLKRRGCPVDRGRQCPGCGGTCNVLSGFGGSIHYGDAVKLSQLPAGRRLVNTLGLQADLRFRDAISLIEETIETPIPFCIPETQHNEEGYSFKPYPVAALSAQKVRLFLDRMYNTIEALSNVSIHMNTRVVDLERSRKGGYWVELESRKDGCSKLLVDYVIVAVGRSGLFWWRDTIRRLGLAFDYPQPSVGLRFELNHRWLMPAGFIHPDYKVSMRRPVGKFKSFCYCGGTGGGRIKYTKYEDFCLLDGHVELADDRPPSLDTAGNFALLYQLPPLPPEVDPIPNLLDHFISPYKALRPDNPGLPVAQRFGDFRHRQTGPNTWPELRTSLDHIPTIDDLVPARIDTLFSDKIHEGFCQSLEQYMEGILLEVEGAPSNLLDNILVIALELEGMWDTIEVDVHLETSSPGLFVTGDAIGVAQGILQAMATGIAAALRVKSFEKTKINNQSIRDRLVYDHYWSVEDYLNPSDTFVEMIDRIKNSSHQVGLIADLGCGIGRHSLYAASRGIKVVAIDHSSRAITKLKDRMNNNKRISPSEGDFPEWLADTANDSLDGIVCFDSIHHVSPCKDDILLILKDMERCLRPGGFLLITLLSDIDYGEGGEPSDRFLASAQEAGQLLDSLFANTNTLRRKQTKVRFNDTVNFDKTVNRMIKTDYQATRVIRLFQIVED